MHTKERGRRVLAAAVRCAEPSERGGSISAGSNAWSGRPTRPQTDPAPIDQCSPRWRCERERPHRLLL